MRSDPAREGFDAVRTGDVESMAQSLLGADLLGLGGDHVEALEPSGAQEQTGALARERERGGSPEAA